MNEISKKGWIRKIAVAGAFCLFVLVIYLGMRSTPGRLSDFTGYYTASSILAHRTSIPDMYRDELFTDQVRKLGLRDTGMVMYVNPPPVSLIMVPLVGLDPEKAKLVWNSLSVCIALLIYLLYTRWSGISDIFWHKLLLFGLLVCTLPFLRNLQRGQVYILMLLFVLMLWRGILTRNDLLTGISLALLLLLKYFGWMFIIFLAIERRWRAVAIAVLVFFLGSAATLYVVGGETYAAHVQRLFSSFASYDAAITGLPNVAAFFGKFLVYHSQWNTGVLVDSPGLATALTLMSLLAMLVVTLRKRQVEGEPPGRTFFGLLVLGVLFTPMAAEHHFILLVLPLFFLLEHFVATGEIHFSTLALPGILVYSILGWYDVGGAPLIAFVRLFGSVALWVLLVRRGVQEGTSSGVVIGPSIDK